MRARCVRCCGSSWSLSGSTISRPRLWSEGRNHVLRPLLASLRRLVGIAGFARWAMHRWPTPRQHDSNRSVPTPSPTNQTRSLIFARTHAQAGMTQLGVSHRTAAAAIFYFLREHFNIHDLDFKMWCDEIGLPSSFTARKLDKQHRRVTQLSATQVGRCCGWLRRGAALRAPPPPACPLANDSCVRSGSLSPGRGIASHRIAW